jgi:dTMP kinase
MAGRFIVLEGGEGVGKSTQVRELGQRLHARGRRVSETREPGGTVVGADIRTALLHSDVALDPRAELLLLLADRAQHVAEVVRPRLAAGEIVLCDRFEPSTLAYQGAARGLGVEVVMPLSQWAAQQVVPDAVIVLDLPDDVAEARIAGERDRLERAGADFHAKVRAAYRDLAPEFGWIIVDAQGTREEVASRVWKAVEPVLT